MLDLAIIGGGLCGVALARSLHAQGRAFTLFEARDRLGGRIKSVPCAESGQSVDLGPTWFWPETQPLITRLVADLALEVFPQHDDGSALYLRDPDKQVERRDGDPLHGGARRLDGGMARLIGALAAGIPEDSIRFDHALAGITDRGDHVMLAFHRRDGFVEIPARRAVLALPPRLLADQVQFEPPLDEAVQDAMRACATWMAARAKVVITYERSAWREAGQSGNAFVTHEQAVLGEIFDACDSTAAKAALGGFVALSPDLRGAFSAGLPMLMENQMEQVFGPALGKGEQHYQDWAHEEFTCSAADRAAQETEHADFANPLLRRAAMGGKLHLAGSETAAHGAGYLEGALESARRVERVLGGSAVTRDDRVAEPVTLNAASIARFSDWVAAQSDPVFDSYRHRLNRGLATQQRDQLTQRALLESLEEVYSHALDFLDGLSFEMWGVAVERGRSALTPQVQAPFGALMRGLVDDVVAFNATSCALSNFPDEHRLSKEYLQTIMRDLAAAWQEFSLSANALLLAKARTEPPQSGNVVRISL